MTVIDVLSKYAWVLPLKSKSGSEVAAALSKIFRDDDIRKIYKRTRTRSSTTPPWLDALSRLISEYNNRAHQTIGMRPADVTLAIAKRLLSTVYSHLKIAAPARFKVNDPVGVSKFKTIFEKRYTPN
ncbi:uncharacterized protein LOC112553066 [Pogonomyrmex barbatus]|uniref:Uncharacterized protein LOC112553066 n=1 Tax=Pogonomyrmex barbatus TaxID=144034 RepID=A0A8N1SC15_9HYME|nr:uncharacterized protein LOC112553066 [Pogonomyrmex barbatus]